MELFLKSFELGAITFLIVLLTTLLLNFRYTKRLAIIILFILIIVLSFALIGKIEVSIYTWLTN